MYDCQTITIYENPFWLKAGYSGQTISDAGPVCATYDHSEGTYQQLTFKSNTNCSIEDIKFYAIIGFVNGKNAIQWRQSSLEEVSPIDRNALARSDLIRVLQRKKAVCEEYAMLWKNKEALEPKEYIEMDWTTEEFSRGKLRNFV